MSQLTTSPPADCHSSQKLLYKQGLWLVRGELLPPKDRPDAQTVLHLVSTSVDISSCATSLVRPLHDSNVSILPCW